MLDKLKTTVFLLAGHFTLYFNSKKTAIKMYEGALESNNDKDSLNYAAAASGVGSILMMYGEFEKAIHYYLKALNVYKNLELTQKKKTVQGMIFGNVGYCYINRNDYETAIKYCEKSREIFEQQDATKKLTKCYNTLMNLYAKTGDMEKAKDYAKLSLKYVSVAEKKYIKGNVKKLLIEDIRSVIGLEANSIINE